MRIELDKNDAVIIRQPLTTNGEGKQRYSMMTTRCIRHYYDFAKLIEALKAHYGVQEK